MDTNEMIALLLPPNGCFACSDTRKEIAEELARRSVDLERECADADKICAALGLTVDKSRTEGGSLNVPRIVGHIQETLTALRESHAFGVAMSDKYVASRAPECAAGLLTSPEMRGRGGGWEADARDADRYSVPLYRADALDAALERLRAERDALRECVRAADAMYAIADHTGGNPGCYRCDAADDYLAARAAWKGEDQ